MIVIRLETGKFPVENQTIPVGNCKMVPWWDYAGTNNNLTDTPGSTASSVEPNPNPLHDPRLRALAARVRKPSFPLKFRVPLDLPLSFPSFLAHKLFFAPFSSGSL